jgi:hypothetical protein
METSKVGIVAVAILMVATVIGFGIAQAERNHSERPVLSFEDMEALDQGISSISEEVPQWANLPEDETQMQNPTETGSLPAESPEDSSTVEIDGILFLRDDGRLYGPP